MSIELIRAVSSFDEKIQLLKHRCRHCLDERWAIRSEDLLWLLWLLNGYLRWAENLSYNSNTFRL